ncbi:ATP-dependent helicase [Candidatus Phytoplasma solani]|uniref:ATP-dependent helicase n=1 Tax=Candidatus Phytoplasma solani TaxID=69896 RepID=UPI00358E5F7D
MTPQIDIWLKKLNKKQNEAVVSPSQTTYLVAGAGTGKTTTLTTKIAYLIEKENIASQNILALTFTNKAANQMKAKVLEMIGEKSRGITVCTFHSLGNQILRRFIDLLPFNYNKNFIILDSKDSNKIIKTVLKEMKLDLKSFEISKLKQHISILKKKDNKQENEQTFLDKTTQTEHNHLNYVNNQNILTEKIKTQYQKYLQSHNFIDFDDLILYTYQLLQEQPKVKSFYQEKFQYLLVDEFQDTDFYQYQILTFLTEKYRRIFVVGDPDQNIYSFRGARFENSQLFLNKFHPQISILEQNYRSSQSILEKANLLISHNKDHPFKKTLKSQKARGNSVNAHFFADSRIEAQFLIQTIKTLVKTSKHRYQDFAILYRNNSFGIFLEKYLLAGGIPYIILGNISFYQSKIVKDLLAYLHVAVNPLQDFYLKRIINVPKRQIGKITLSHLEKIQQEKKISLFEVLDNLNEVLISENTKQKLYQFKDFIKNINNQIINNQFNNLSDIITYVNQETQYSKQFTSTKQKNSQQENNTDTILSYIEELKSVLLQTDQNLEGNNLDKLTQFLEEINLYSETSQNTSHNNFSNNCVKLSTIHKVKGLEFKVVFVSGLEQEIFDDKNNLDESRRLTYVAVTRAQEKLFLTGAFERKLYGEVRTCTPSRFLKEMGFGAKKHLSYLPNQNFFQKGDQVKHHLFGLGMIKELQENLIIVKFLNPPSIKHFDPSTNFLKKI